MAQRTAVSFLRQQHGYSERRACRLLDVNRCTARRIIKPKDDEKLRQRIIEIAEERRRFGAMRIHIMLRRECFIVNHKRTERIYREEGLSLRLKNRKKRPSYTRIEKYAPTGPDQKWSLDFVSDALINGRRFKMLTIEDVWDRSCPGIEVDLSLSGTRVVRVLERLRQCGRTPKVIHIDNGPEFTSKALDAWAMEHGVKLEFSRPGRPIDNCHLESFNGRLRDECLNQQLFVSLESAKTQIESWRIDYNENRPHSSLNWCTPVEYRRLHQNFLSGANANL